MSDPMLGAQKPKTKSNKGCQVGKIEQRSGSRSDPEERGTWQSVASDWRHR